MDLEENCNCIGKYYYDAADEECLSCDGTCLVNFLFFPLF